jgi:hypothetical protein
LLALTLAVPSAKGADLSAQYSFKPVRIGGGGWIRGLSVHPANPNVRLARSDTHGAFRWDGTKNEWVQMFTAQSLPAAYTRHPGIAQSVSVALDPSNQNVVLVALRITQSGDIFDGSRIDNRIRMFRSTDGGKTFVVGNLDLPYVDPPNFDQEYFQEAMDPAGETLQIDPNNGQIAYYCNRASGLWRSADGGLTWTNVRPCPDQLDAASPGFLRFDGSGGTTSVGGKTVTRTLYLTQINQGVVQSNDGGQSWQPINDPGFSGANTRMGPIEVASNGTLYLGQRRGDTLWRRPRGGAWSTTDVSNPGNLDTITELAPDPNNPDRVFVAHELGPITRALFDASGAATVTRFGNVRITTSDIPYLAPSPIRPLGLSRSLGGFQMDKNGRLWLSTGNDGIVTVVPNDTANSETNPPGWSVSNRGIEQQVSGGVLLPPGQKPLMVAWEHTTFLIDNPDSFTGNTIFNLNTWAPSIPSGPWDFVSGLSSAMMASYCPNATNFIVQNSADMHAMDPHENFRKWAGYSTDGGRTWSLFPSLVNRTHPEVLFGGQISVSARAAGQGNAQTNIVWIPPYGAAPFYSKDGGASWTQTTSFDTYTRPGNSRGVLFKPRWYSGGFNDRTGQFEGTFSFTRQPGYSAFILGGGQWEKFMAQKTLIADQKTPGTFYYFLPNWDLAHFYKSTDGGVTWQEQTNAQTQLPAQMWHGQLVANPNVAGDLWLADGIEGAFTINGNGGLPKTDYHGIWHSTNGGASWTKITGFDHAAGLALGKSSTANGYPAIYVYGKRSGDAWGIWRSTNTGATWDKLSSYPAGTLDKPVQIAASQDEFGLIYIATAGSSFFYGKPIAVAADTAQYNFETGTQGWYVEWLGGTATASLATSTAEKYAGNQSLRVNLAASSPTGTSSYAFLRVLNPPAPIIGKTITFRYWLPAGHKVKNIFVYGYDAYYSGTTNIVSAGAGGVWRSVTLTIPTSAAPPISAIGLGFEIDGTWTGSAYIDSVRW